MKKTVQVIIDVFFKILIFLMLAYVVLWLFGIKFYAVPTGSMEPYIHAGSLVVINENVSYDDVDVGDVIVYDQTADRRIIHRIIQKDENGIIVQGDANPVPDGAVITEKNYVGKFIKAFPEIGTKIEKMNNIWFKLAYIAVILGLCVVDVLLDVDTMKKEKKTLAEKAVDRERAKYERKNR